ncbi:MAG TPA: hypothetical protein VF519_06090 [Mycobacteriales bacterium]
MRRLAVALLVLGALAAPARADHERFFTVSGNGPGYVDVRFPTAVRLDGGLTKFRTTGRVAGVYVHPLTRGITASELVVSVRDIGLVGDSSGAVTLPAGAYRVYLISDGRASLRMLAHGLRDNVTVQAAHRAPMRLDSGPVTIRPDGPLRYRGERAVRLRGGGAYVSTAYSVTIPKSDVPTWGRLQHCLGDAAQCESATDGYVPSGRTSQWGQQSYPPGSIDGPTVLRERYAGTAQATVVTFAVEIPF